MLTNQLKIALRALLRGRTYTALNVIGLAIGLACFGLIAAWVLNELSFDRFHEKHERIVRVVGRVTTDSEVFDQAVTSPPMGMALKDMFPEVENAVTLHHTENIVRVGDKQFLEEGVLFADPSVFDMFSYRLMEGDVATALKEPYSIVLTESMAGKYFGEENPIGKTVTIFAYDATGQGAPYQVTGVMADPPRNAHFTFQCIGSFSTLYAANPGLKTEWWRWFNNGSYTYLLLKEGTDAGALEKKLPQFAENFMGERMGMMKMFYHYTLQPLASIHLESHLRYEITETGDRTTVYLFATIGACILFLACINYMNLATARSLSRAKEVGVKKVLGAGRAELIRQFIAESLLTAAGSLLLAILLMELLQPLFIQLTGNSIGEFYTAELIVLLLGSTVAVGFVSGLYPAFFVSNFKPLTVLRGTFQSSPGGNALRKGLVVFQFIVSITLLIGIGVVHTQMEFVQTKDLGYEKENLLVLDVNGFAEVLAGIRPFEQELRSHPAVEGVALSRGLIVGGLGNSHIETVDGAGNPVSSSIYQLRVGFEYVDVYRMKIVAGRDFNPGIAADSIESRLVNVATVRAFGWGDPENAIGKPIKEGEDTRRVVGVVKDFHFASLQESIQPVAIGLFPTNRFSRIAIRFQAGQAANLVRFAEATWKKHFPNAFFQHSFLDERLMTQYQREQLLGSIFLAFVALSLIIACLGLFGLASYAIDRRVKEIGVRKVLGASLPGIVLLLSKDFLKLVGLAFVIACPLAYVAMNGWLQDFAYRVEVGPGLFLLAGALAMVIAFLPVAYHSIRSGLSNPVDALRYE